MFAQMSCLDAVLVIFSLDILIFEPFFVLLDYQNFVLLERHFSSNFSAEKISVVKLESDRDFSFNMNST